MDLQRSFGTVALGVVAVLAVTATTDLALATPPPCLDDLCLEVRSASGRFVAAMNGDASATIIFEIREGQRQERWRMKGWTDAMFLDDDGLHLVRGHWRWNGFPRAGRKQSTPILHFFRQGTLVHTATLGEIISVLTDLRCDDDDCYWGRYGEFVAPGRFAVDTYEHRRLIFDVATGKVIDNIESPADWLKRSAPKTRSPKKRSPPAKKGV